MKVALIGYGKMGREIAQICVNRGHAIVHEFTSSRPLDQKALSDVDVAIEFTNPTAVVSNLQNCFEAGIPVVTGTTGWYDQMNAVTKQCNAQEGSLFWASNFSMGVNLFFEFSRYIAKTLNRFPDYQVSIEDIHHKHKLDAPSGTAVLLSQILTEELDAKTGWAFEKDAGSKDIPVTSLRQGEVIGTHQVCFESPVDKLSIVHEAKNRTGFAMGAVLAAEWLQNKKGVYTMKDLLKS